MYDIQSKITWHVQEHGHMNINEKKINRSRPRNDSHNRFSNSSSNKIRVRMIMNYL